MEFTDFSALFSAAHLQTSVIIRNVLIFYKCFYNPSFALAGSWVNIVWLV